MARRHRRIDIPLNVTSYGLGVILLGHLLSVFAANDKGIAVIGLLRALMLSGFWMWWSNLESPLKESIRGYIPDVAAILTAITILLYFYPMAREHLFRAERMGDDSRCCRRWRSRHPGSAQRVKIRVR